MTNPVAPGALTPLTPQIPLDAGIAAVSTNRRVHFDETVTMVEQLNVVLPKVHQNAMAAKEGAAAAVAAKSAAELAKTGAESARDSAETAADRAEQAAADVERPVSKDDKATAADVAAGTADKWVDAAAAKVALDEKQPAGAYASEESVAELEQKVNAAVTLSGTQTLSNKTLTNAKETQTNLAATNVLTPSTTSNATIRPTGAISFSGVDSASSADVGKSMVAAITPSAAVTFTSNAAVKWPGSGAAPTLTSGKTYMLSLANMQIGNAYYWLANIAGPY